MIEIAYAIFVVLVSGAIACGVVRLWRGPTVADRLNAADVIALCGIGLVIGHGWIREDSLWLDVAMVAGIVLFVGTAAVSLFLDPEHLSSSDDN